MSKKESFIVFLVGIMIGISLGYAWRMVQVDQLVEREIHVLQSENQMLRENYRKVLGEYAALKAKKERR